jgi:hypothetical protein
MATWELTKTGLLPLDFGKRIDTAANLLGKFAAGSSHNIAAHIAARSQVNAPILTGLLRSAIEASPPQATGGGFESTVTYDDAMLGSENIESQATLESYLPLMFQFLEPYAIFPFFKLGPISRVQPMQPEGGVGGQWLPRVVNYHTGQYLLRMSEAVAKLFEKARLPLPLHFNP